MATRNGSCRESPKISTSSNKTNAKSRRRESRSRGRISRQDTKNLDFENCKHSANTSYQKNSRGGRHTRNTYGASRSKVSPYPYHSSQYKWSRSRQYGEDSGANNSYMSNSNVSFNENEFITSTAHRNPVCPLLSDPLPKRKRAHTRPLLNDPPTIEHRSNRRPLLNDPPTIEHRPNRRPLLMEFHAMVSKKSVIKPFLDTNYSSKNSQKNDTPHLPSNIRPNSKIFIDRIGNQNKGDIIYTTVGNIIKPKKSCVSNDITPDEDTNLDSNKNTSKNLSNESFFPSVERNINITKQKNESEQAIAVVNSSVQMDLEISPVSSDIPCGQGNNTNFTRVLTEKCDEISSFFSQVPPSLPCSLDMDKKDTEIHHHHDNSHLAEESNRTVNFSRLDKNKSNESRNTTVSRLSHEEKLISNILQVKQEIVDSIPTSQDKISLRSNFNSSKNISTSLFANKSYSGEQAGESSNILNNSKKLSPRKHNNNKGIMSHINGCDINHTRPLNLYSQSECEITQIELKKETEVTVKPCLNMTQPLNLCSQGHSESIFNDIENNHTQDSALKYFSDAENSPTKATVPTTSTNKCGDIMLDMNPIQSPQLESTTSHINNNVESTLSCQSQKDTCPESESIQPNLQLSDAELNVTSRCQSSILPGNIIYQKYGSTNIENILCTSKSILSTSTDNNKDRFQNSGDWQSLNCEVDSICTAIRDIFKDKLQQLNGSKSDSLVCCMKIMDFQNDSCINNNKYIFHIKNEKIDTMRILSKCMSPRAKNEDIEASSYTEYEEKPLHTKKHRNKKEKKSDCDTDLTSRQDFSDTALKTESVDSIHKKKKKRSSNSDEMVQTCNKTLTEEEQSTKKKHKKSKKVKLDELPQSNIGQPPCICKERKKRRHKTVDVVPDSPPTKKIKKNKDKKKNSDRVSETSEEGAEDIQAAKTKHVLRKMVRSEVKDFISQINISTKSQTNATDNDEENCQKKKKHKDSKKGVEDVKNEKKKKDKSPKYDVAKHVFFT